MTLRIATAFQTPSFIAKAARIFGIRILSQTGLEEIDWLSYSQVSYAGWGRDQILFREALLAFHDAESQAPTTAGRIMGITTRCCGECLIQTVSSDCLYRFNFVRTCLAAFPDAIAVVDFPPAFVYHLRNRGVRFNGSLSVFVWWIKRVRMFASGLAAHMAHAILLVRDTLLPYRLGSTGDIVLWPSVAAVEMLPEPNALNVSDFIARSTALLAGATVVLCEGDSSWRHAPPARLVGSLFRTRRVGHPSISALTRGLADQARLIQAMIAGGWQETYLSRQIACLPRVRACLAELAPKQVTVTTSHAQHLPLWFALARNLGASVHMVCYSTQIHDVQCRDGRVPGVIQDIFMFLNADRYLVWNDSHAKHLRDIGVAADDIEIAGPQILSGKPQPGCEDKGRDGTIVIDFFDQPPASRSYLIRIGAPTIYHTPERALAAIDGVLDAMQLAFGEQPWQLRIKSKRDRGSQTAAAYTDHLAELAEIYDDKVVLLAPETSPLYLHPGAHATIGFPYVSPVVSATLVGCPGAFFDATNEVYEGDGIAGNIPVLRDVNSLTVWLTSAVKSQMLAGGSPYGT